MAGSLGWLLRYIAAVQRWKSASLAMFVREFEKRGCVSMNLVNFDDRESTGDVDPDDQV